MAGIVATLLSVTLLSSNLSWAAEEVVEVDDVAAVPIELAQELEPAEVAPEPKPTEPESAVEEEKTQEEPVAEPGEDAPLDQPTGPSELAGEEASDAANLPSGPVEAGLAQDVEPEATAIQPMALGPDGESAPYIYWDVRDTKGDLVAGATFTFERRSGWGWGGERSVEDCTGNCGSLYDKDVDGGEFLVKWIGNNPSSGTGSDNVVQNNSRYRITPGNPPDGYSWFNSGAVESSSWSGSSGNRTLNFGTFTVVKQSTNLLPVCEAGYVYGVSSSGQLQQIDPAGEVALVGNPASGVSSFNGIGIGTDGEPVYAYERTNGAQTVTMYEFNTETGEWTNTGDSYNTTLSANGGYSGSLVAGAVNLNTDKYMFGGFQTWSTGSGPSTRYHQDFKIWEYDPSASPAFTYKGHVPTVRDSSQSLGGANGDMAFNAAGDLFIVRGSGTSTTVFSVTTENLAAASGGEIPSAGSNSFDTMNNVNGVAFDADGRAFLGSSNTIRSYDMPNWDQNPTSDVTNFVSSTDLASCSSPPTITIEKVVQGARVSDTDQFRLELKQGNDVIGEATTEGSESGEQAQRIGPMPTVRNIPLVFSEVEAGTANLSNYATSYRCTLDGTQMAEGNATSGTITIPPQGDNVVCTFYNSPLIAEVLIHKDVADHSGENAVAGQGWTVGAAVQATAGSVSSVTPSNSAQETDSDGDAGWSILFGTYQSRATVTVSEQQQTGYEFVSGSCEVAHLDGTTTAVELASEAGHELAGLQPGDQVQCRYLNKQKPGEVSWVKTDAFDDTALAGSVWNVTGPNFDETVEDCVAESSEDCAGLDKDQRAGYFRLAGLAWGEYTATETTVPEGYTGASEFTFAVTSANAGTTIVMGKQENERILGSVEWSKIDSEGEQLLGGSVWELTGPGESGATREIVDCEASPCAEDGDQDPAPGEFLLEDLQWGDYTLTEKTAPEGYSPREKAISFTVEAAHLQIELEPVPNERVLGTVSWAKTGPDGSDRLAGSEWSLTGSGGEVTIVDCVEESADDCEGPDINPAAGEFLIEELPWGSYTLVETKAPAGYVKSTKVYEFDIGVGENKLLEVPLGDIENEQRDGPVLPLTGGLIGRDFFLILGLSVLTLGLGAAAVVQIRGRRKEVA